MHLHCKHYTFNGHSALVITTRDTMHPKLLLAAHIDVVPGPEALFTPKIDNDNQRMYGRGAYDMKMAIACYMLLLEELKERLGELDFGIMLTSDEEIGGMNGVRCLLEAGYSADAVLLPDGGFNWNFEEAAKGVLHVKGDFCWEYCPQLTPMDGKKCYQSIATCAARDQQLL